MTTDELSKLSPEEKRVKIATACGWRNVRNTTILKGRVLREGVFGIPPHWPHEYVTNEPVPDYLNSLDAMHEAEKIFDTDVASGDSPRYLYSRMLYDVVPPELQPFRATAAQRADAFLLTL